MPANPVRVPDDDDDDFPLNDDDLDDDELEGEEFDAGGEEFDEGEPDDEPDDDEDDDDDDDDEPVARAPAPRAAPPRAPPVADNSDDDDDDDDDAILAPPPPPRAPRAPAPGPVLAIKRPRGRPPKNAPPPTNPESIDPSGFTRQHAVEKRGADFVTLAESTFNRTLFARQQETTTSLTPAGGSAALPTDYLLWRRVTWLGVAGSAGAVRGGWDEARKATPAKT